MEINRKKNEATYCVNALIDSANRPARKSGATVAAGDVVAHTYTGSWDTANVTVAEIASTGAYLCTITKTMVNPTAGYPVVISFKDVAGAEWDDNLILIWTRDNDMDDLVTKSDLLVFE